ncbi:DNA N-6-adenine-methyltransferase [Enterococcus faecalis]|uniref:DNA N-6-adenine-methyltransferase n=1 Tax=Enterococcus faecalis TaxID=1351 RepID=UPI001927731F|nr:DNA N-6-adenine-methyltransferase [Enterococcus faecalis]EGO2800512.1 adenine methyltransferase [Enterococcus faecalis]EGO8511844.1 adenine methyltransferase [Enterococcus faecalis]EGQ7428341.1 adenine methyltransferase [Enterococcus faecalis]EJB2752629.1 adenine methyltransferase [Enterococcus faecalis]EKZ0433812.1 adenine methyltransferase [Enterococcus faecalis]
MNKNLHFSSEKDDWETPQKLFDELNEKYQFDIDVAASARNAKLPKYFTKEDNALIQEWDGNVFCNPPYGRELRKWLEKGYQEYLRVPERTIVFLIPARTDTSYWHDFIFGKAYIQFLRGRVKFEIDGEGGNSAPFPSAVVIFGNLERSSQ